MTEEQNKLAEEIEQLLASVPDTAGYAEPRIFIRASLANNIIAALRKPATEAVRDAVLEEAACMAESGQTETVELVPGNFRIERSRPATGKEIAAAIRALKGKGASQGAVWIPVARTEAATKYVNAAPGRPVWFVDGNGQIWHYNLPPLPAPDEQKG